VEQRQVPVVVVEEQMRGRLAQIRAAESQRDREKLLTAYGWLAETAGFFADVTIVPFDDAALTQYETLRRVHRDIGSQDLKIAAIALTRGAILVTPNVAHFRSISGLRVEDWTGSETGA
jgi:tRNA(fMet)-specific endonuclease VapC